MIIMIRFFIKFFLYIIVFLIILSVMWNFLIGESILSSLFGYGKVNIEQ
jgi:hypothetical protein